MSALGKEVRGVGVVAALPLAGARQLAALLRAKCQDLPVGTHDVPPSQKWPNRTLLPVREYVLVRSAAHPRPNGRCVRKIHAVQAFQEQGASLTLERTHAVPSFSATHHFYVALFHYSYRILLKLALKCS